MGDDALSSTLESAKSELVVVFHGAWGRPDQMAGVVQAVAAARPNAEVIVPLMPGLSSRTSTVPPAQVAMLVADLIDAAWEKSGGAYERIVLVAYSAGGMIARKVVILGHGEVSSLGAEHSMRVLAPFEAEIKKRFAKRRPWANKIERVVLLAGFNKGLSVSGAKDWVTAVKWSVGLMAAECLRMIRGQYPTLTELRCGSPFMVQTRLQWLALMRGKAYRGLIVQLIGTLDDLVPLADAVDFDIDVAGDVSTFWLLEVPHTNHATARIMTRPTCQREQEDEPPTSLRWRRFVSALSETPAQLAEKAVLREHLADALPPQPDVGVHDVVFVIHGIRDKGHWTQKIARQIKLHARAAKKQVHSVTASYGYLAMLPFVIPWVRRRKVEWLMDRYTEARAQFPEADISYVGHSNGTYLAAAALQDYPAARFKRIVFAGSVVRRDYDWAKLCQGSPESPPRVQSVLSYVATADWVVAIFPKALEPFRRWFQLGSAGHSGFDQCRDKTTNALQEVHYVRGGHSAGIAETQWDNIAQFIVSGLPPSTGDAQTGGIRPDYAKRQGFLVRYVLGPFATLWVAASLALVVGIGVALATAVFCGAPFPWFQTTACAFPSNWVMLMWLAALALYAWLVSLIITRI